MKAVVLFSKRLGENEMLNFKEYEQYFQENGVELTRIYADTEDEIIAAAKGYDVVMDMMQPMTAKIIDALDCKALIRGGIGVSNYDVDAATRNRIMLCNSPSHCIQEVAVLNAAHIFNAVTKLSSYVSEIRKGESAAFDAPRRLSVMKVGLVGFGKIARHLANIMLGAGCTVLAYDPYLSDDAFSSMGVQRRELDDLLAEADIISLHVPLFPSTRHIINRDAFAKMKDGVIIVNTGRGGLIDQEALKDALKRGKVGAAGLDVVEIEPVTQSDPELAAMPQVYCSPHVGYRGVEAIEELEATVARMVVQVANGQTPDYVVNLKDLQANT